MTEQTADTTPPAEEIVYSLAISPDFAQDGIFFAARSSGLYRSLDGGVTWSPAYDSLNLTTPLPTLAVAISPDFRSDHTVWAGVAGGIVRSVDGGEMWTAAILPSPPPVVSALVVSPNFIEDGKLFAATMEDGVLTSTDRGQRWVAWNFGLLDLRVLAIAISPHFAADETLFVGTESGIFRSTNGGRAWREVNFPTDYAPVLSLALSPDYATSGLLYAGTEAHGLYRSADRGKTWQRVGEATIAEAVNSIILAPDFPARPDILVLSGAMLWVSHNGGETWVEWPTDVAASGAITSVLAPEGLAAGAPLWLGRVGGAVQKSNYTPESSL